MCKQPYLCAEAYAVKAMILAAGLGTRLLPLTRTVPKPMLKLAGEPLIGHQLRALSRGGVSDVMINLHHLKEQIIAYVGTGEKFGVSVHYSEEDQLLETGGAIRKILGFFEESPFWLLNGDIWTDFEFKNLPNRVPERTAHLVLTPTPEHREHGDFEFAKGKVVARGEPYVYCGIACLHPSIMRTSEPQQSDQELGDRDLNNQALNNQEEGDQEYGEIFSLRDIYFALMAEGRLNAQIHQGSWHDIGTLPQYEALLAKHPN